MKYSAALKAAVRETLARGGLTAAQLSKMELDEFLEVVGLSVAEAAWFGTGRANLTKVPTRWCLTKWSELEDDKQPMPLRLTEIKVRAELLVILGEIRRRYELSFSSACRRAVEIASAAKFDQDFVAGLHLGGGLEELTGVRVQDRHREILAELMARYDLERAEAYRLAIEVAGRHIEILENLEKGHKLDPDDIYRRALKIN